MPSRSRGFALERGLLHRFARHNPLLCIKHLRFRAGHHGACSQQDPSGHPPRIGGQGQETVGARRLTERAARHLMPRGSPSAQSSNIIESSISADPKIRAGDGRASPPAVALAALRAVREVTQIMLKV